MGRSSNSSHYQLSANRLISRIHVKARYIASAETYEPNKIEIICNGWNGLKLHCQGQTWELAKGDSFTSETDGAEIMIDVQDARVLLQWPKREKERDVLANLSDSSWDESPRPRIGRGANSELHGSPLRRTTRITSPESPTPANVSTSNASLQDLLATHGHEDTGTAVQIYEDASGDEQELPKLPSAGKNANASFLTQVADSFSSDLSEPQSDDEENNPNEENDPIVHSFGPFGANLVGRMESFSTFSPERLRGQHNFHSSRSSISSGTAGHATPKPLQLSNANSTNSSPRAASFVEQPLASPLDPEKTETITNHVINQLAFSRVSQTPLSTIMSNLPASERKDLKKEQLRTVIEATKCIGIIRRQGKDAAGKPLESDYYYVPEFDTDEHRRLAVTESLRKPSLRNCRKQHKVRLTIFPLYIFLPCLKRILTSTLAILLEAT